MADNLTCVYQSGNNRVVGIIDAGGATQGWDSGTLNDFNYEPGGNIAYLFDASRARAYEIWYDHVDRVSTFALYVAGVYTQSHYRYNSDGQRYWKKIGGASPEYYLMDGSVALGVTSNGTDVDWNIVTPNGQVIGRRPYNNNKRFYITDHLGSVRTVIDHSGSVLETRDYYPFGLQLPGRTRTQSWDKAKEDFTGHELDTESGMHYAGARYYMPNIGRWTSVDPLADKFPAWSPYNYVLNNPVRLVDPTGMAPEDTLILNRNGDIVYEAEGGADYVGVQASYMMPPSQLPVSLLSIGLRYRPTGSSQVMLSAAYSSRGPWALSDRSLLVGNVRLNPVQGFLGMFGLSASNPAAGTGGPAPSNQVAPGLQGTAGEIAIRGVGTPPNASSILLRSLVPDYGVLSQPLAGTTMPSSWVISRHVTGTLDINVAGQNGWNMMSTQEIVRSYFQDPYGIAHEIMRALWSMPR